MIYLQSVERSWVIRVTIDMQEAVETLGEIDGSNCHGRRDFAREVSAITSLS